GRIEIGEGPGRLVERAVDLSEGEENARQGAGVEGRAGLGVAALPLPERQPVDLTPSPDGIPQRRYDTDTLERIAASTPTLACECPHHLVDLVAGLSAFEDYSAQCENRSPEDAALHHWLRATTAQARALMEEALTRVAGAEGLLR
ncbi:MAG TPA: hypothetical protein PK403_08325, partial [Plasticicumulans sp.]|nr:hypothetical protein [Plasticicumulans sp.]